VNVQQGFRDVPRLQDVDLIAWQRHYRGQVFDNFVSCQPAQCSVSAQQASCVKLSVAPLVVLDDVPEVLIEEIVTYCRENRLQLDV